ncbi:hypothetical protein OG693_04120 [Streptomyces sp. NBC_01259]|uniref:hypothetical protein n=1 Tax=Streptomyces sp. NBC_01259 TaxID=2903800 RepID=UPI00325548ED
MQYTVLRTLTVALLAGAVTAPQATATAAQGLLPSLPLRGGSTFDFCLTDTSASALSKAGITMEAIAPSTLVSDQVHRCVRTVLAGGKINSDLSGLTATAKDGGFAFHRGNRRAEFTAIAAKISPDRTGTITVTHRKQRIDVLTTKLTGLKLSLTKITAKNVPMSLTPAGANALAKEFTTSPLPAGHVLFAGNSTAQVLPLTASTGK